MSSRRAPATLPVDLLLVVGVFFVDAFGTGHTELRTPGTAGYLLPIVATGLASLSLLWRRRAPWAVFAVWWFHGLLALLPGGPLPFAGLLVAVATLTARRSRTPSLLAVLLSVVPMQINAWTVLEGRAELSTVERVGTPLFWALLPLAAWAFGRVIRLLRDQQELQQRLHQAELSTVIRDERLRLARDLHDVVAHAVSAMILQAAGARSLDDRTDERIKDALRSVETTGADAMRELHRLLGLLRTPSDEPPPLTAQPGIGDLDQVIETTRACGVQVSVDESGDRRPLDPEVSYTAFRMVQECMANVIKHGGAGAECTLRIAWQDDGVQITVRSDEHDAVTATTLSGGYGLRGLTERAQQVGGRFDAGPEAESIFVASMSLPFRPRAAVAGG